jgi:hypothetical protein
VSARANLTLSGICERRDGTGSLSKYSFLCPNGTLFNQVYFICDWWFNVDCSQVVKIEIEIKIKHTLLQ